MNRILVVLGLLLTSTALAQQPYGDVPPELAETIARNNVLTLQYGMILRQYAAKQNKLRASGGNVYLEKIYSLEKDIALLKAEQQSMKSMIESLSQRMGGIRN